MSLSIASRSVFRPDFFAVLRKVPAWFTQMRQAVIGRRAIAQMDGRMLADIGLSRAEAQAEINRRPWDFAPKAGLGRRDRV